LRLCVRVRVRVGRGSREGFGGVVSLVECRPDKVESEPILVASTCNRRPTRPTRPTHPTAASPNHCSTPNHHPRPPAPLLLRPRHCLVKLEERLERAAPGDLRPPDQPPHPALQLLPPPVQEFLLVAQLQGVLGGRLEQAVAHQLRQLGLELSVVGAGFGCVCGGGGGGGMFG